MGAFIRITGLKKIYKVGSEKVRALNGIDLSIEKGEVCCILGTSGSGKSTLLNMIAGLERPTKGQIMIGKYNIGKMSENELTNFRQQYLGFIFQSYNLMGGLSALENVAMPLQFRGINRSKREKTAAAALKAVGLANRMEHKPTEMSGGQQQRVGIARAFVHRPKLIFADEPTGNLDTHTSAEVMDLMVTMERKHKQTLIIVTHDSEVAASADRIIRLADGKVESDDRNILATTPTSMEEVPKQDAPTRAVAATESDTADIAPSPGAVSVIPAEADADA